MAFRERRWSPARGGAFLVGNTDQLPDDDALRRAVRPLSEPAGAATVRAGAGLSAGHPGRGARDQPVAPADGLPAVDRPARRAPASRARDLRDAARRLDGLAPVRRDPRATRPLLLGLGARPQLRRRPDARARLRARLEQVRRGLRADARDRRRAAPRTARARRRWSARAPTPPAASCWRSRTRARSRATPPTRRSSTTTQIDPDAAIAAVDGVTFDEVRRRRARDQRAARGRLRRPARGRDF